MKKIFFSSLLIASTMYANVQTNLCKSYSSKNCGKAQIDLVDGLYIVQKKTIPKPKPKIDSDKDGVYDDVDKCPNTLAGAKVDKNGCITKYILKVHFAKDSAKVQKKYFGEIDRFANYVKTLKYYNLEIGGHTDSDASNEYNKHLSQRRANNVVKELIKRGLKREWISAVGYGEEKPLNGNKTKEEKFQNRRIEAIFSKVKY